MMLCALLLAAAAITRPPLLVQKVIASRVPPLALNEATVPLKKTTSPWLNLWFPVMFIASIEEGQLVPATIFERPLVLFRDEHEAVKCLADQCPHRLAPLSDGRLTSDKAGATRVECSYHGWQFGGCGRCTLLPQLEQGKPILKLYDAKTYPVSESQGIAYVFLGDAEKAANTPLPAVPELDADGCAHHRIQTCGAQPCGAQPCGAQASAFNSILWHAGGTPCPCPCLAFISRSRLACC